MGGGTSGKPVGEYLKLAVEKDERSVDVTSAGRTLYDNEKKWWEIEIVRYFSSLSLDLSGD